jgi:hypothetical protein
MVLGRHHRTEALIKQSEGERRTTFRKSSGSSEVMLFTTRNLNPIISDAPRKKARSDPTSPDTRHRTAPARTIIAHADTVTTERAVSLLRSSIASFENWLVTASAKIVGTSRIPKLKRRPRSRLAKLKLTNRKTTSITRVTKSSMIARSLL